MAIDPLKRLKDAGTPVESLNDDQRAVLQSLSESELDVLTSVQARLATAGGDDVEAQDVFKKY